VLKGLQNVGLIASESTGDLIRVLDAEGLKEVYSATRDKVNWWPLR
ncbi:MAG: Crp/Fnr family transcriptional regulator, partial [Microcystis sp.]